MISGYGHEPLWMRSGADRSTPPLFKLWRVNTGAFRGRATVGREGLTLLLASVRRASTVETVSCDAPLRTD